VGNPAYHVEYVFKNKSNESKVLKQWTVKGADGYIISYIGDPTTYSNNLQVVEKMIGSIEINIGTNKGSIFRTGDFLKYENSNHKISIHYPPDWQKLDITRIILFTVFYSFFHFQNPFITNYTIAWLFILLLFMIQEVMLLVETIES
jgi:hypothetical protein